MPLHPKVSDIPKIRGALRFYQVFSYITGIMLLLLVLEMLLKYTPIAREIELGGAYGFLALVPVGTVTAVNLSTGILIIHGWLYVVYLFSDFRLWSFMRWPFWRFILIAFGGVVPFLSFIVESFTSKRVKRELAALLEPAVPVPTPESAEASH
jgi:integral membrane protein